ncbi:hypothetical protein LUZ60_006167 [Juncus effusus]|nr:hypothetical protein LUZ60_006167 [Juncus effusus]
MAVSKNKSYALLSYSSLLMSLLFAYSALVQLNDPDWYFWLPLYSGAFVVNLFKLSKRSTALNQVANMSLIGGFLLYIKVVVEDWMNGIAGFWSIDMRERVVREKIGSALVFLSMLLHLKLTHLPKQSKKETTHQPFPLIETGMALLAAGSYGLSIYVLAFVNKEEMIFS